MAFKFPWQIHVGKTTLLDLNRDVFEAIFDSILTSNYWSQSDTTFWAKRHKEALIPLSLTCKHLRALVAPQMFRTIKWPGNFIYDVVPLGSGGFKLLARCSDIPEAILLHVRHLLIRCDQKFPIHSLLCAIPKMTSLSHCIFNCKWAPPLELLQSLTCLSSLIALELLQTPFDSQPNSYSFLRLEFLSIRPTLGYIRTNGGIMRNASTSELALGMMGSGLGALDEEIRAAQSRRPIEGVTSAHLLVANISSLQRLEIEASLFPWTDLGALNWPCLHTLIFTGAAPLGQTIPLVTLLKGMTSLKDLQFRWISEPKHTFCLVPQVCSGLVSAQMLTRLFPVLRSLTLSNPSPKDLIYSIVPSSLEYLYFPVISFKKQCGTGLSLSHATRIIHSVATGNVMVQGLQLVLHDDIALPSFISLISLRFPQLQTLEVSTILYRPHIMDVTPWEAYAEALTPLRQLKVLRMASYFESNMRNGWLGVDQEEAKCAVFLAERLPQLEYVAFQSVASSHSFATDPSWNTWTQYDIIRDGVGGRAAVRWNDASY